jgi:hypothetical protein
MESTTDSERWHELLTTRYVCAICLTRFFCAAPVLSGVPSVWVCAAAGVDAADGGAG